MPSFQIVTHPPLTSPACPSPSPFFIIIILLLLLLLLFLFVLFFYFFILHLVISFSVPDNATASISSFVYDLTVTRGLVNMQ